MGSGASTLKETSNYRLRTGHASSGNESYRLVDLFPSSGTSSDTYAVCLERLPSEKTKSAGDGQSQSKAKRISIQQMSDSTNKKAAELLEKRWLAQSQITRKPVSSTTACVDKWRRQTVSGGENSVRSAAAVLLRHNRLIATSFGGARVLVCRRDQVRVVSPKRLAAQTYSLKDLSSADSRQSSRVTGARQRRLFGSDDDDDDAFDAADVSADSSLDDNNDDDDDEDNEELSVDASVVELDTHTQFVLLQSASFARLVSPKLVLAHLTELQRQKDEKFDAGNRNNSQLSDDGSSSTSTVRSRSVSDLGIQEMVESLLSLAKQRASTSSERRSLSLILLAFEFSPSGMAAAGGGALPYRRGDLLGHADLKLAHKATAAGAKLTAQSGSKGKKKKKRSSDNNGEEQQIADGEPAGESDARTPPPSALRSRKKTGPPTVQFNDQTGDGKSAAAAERKHQLARLVRVTEMRREIVLDEPFLLCALAACGDTAGLQSLLAGGISPGAADYDGRTALHVAAAHGQLSVAKLLLAAGAPVNAVDNFSRTPLHQAIEMSQSATADTLREHGGHLGRRVRESAGAKAVLAEQRLTRYRTWFNSLHSDAKEIGKLPTEVLTRWLWKKCGLRPAKLDSAARPTRPCSAPLSRILAALVDLDASRDHLLRDDDKIDDDVFDREYAARSSAKKKGVLQGKKSAARKSRQGALDAQNSTISWSRFSTMMIADLSEEQRRIQQREMQRNQQQEQSTGTRQEEASSSRDEFIKRIARVPINPLKLAVQKQLAFPSWVSMVSRFARLFREVSEIPARHLYGQPGLLLSDSPNSVYFAGDSEDEAEATAAAIAEGKIPRVSDRIGPLADVDEEEFSVCLVSVDGQTFEMGDWSTEFPMLELISPLLYAFALSELGPSFVHRFVGHSPGGSISEYTLDAHDRPLHALTTGGAMVISTMIDAHLSLSHRFGRMIRRMQSLAGGMRVSFSQATYLAEQGSSYGTFALAHFIHAALPSPVIAAQTAFAAEQRKQQEAERRRAEEEQKRRQQQQPAGGSGAPPSTLKLKPEAAEAAARFLSTVSPGIISDHRLMDSPGLAPGSAKKGMTPRRLVQAISESAASEYDALQSPMKSRGAASNTSLTPAAAAAQVRARRLALQINDDNDGEDDSEPFQPSTPHTGRRSLASSVEPTPKNVAASRAQAIQEQQQGQQQQHQHHQNESSAAEAAAASLTGAGGEAAAAARIKDLVDFFFQMMAIEVNTATVASFAATLAASGRSPLSGESVLDADAVKSCLQLMYSTGTQLSGEWSNTIGLPAKSSETGTIMMVLPDRLGLCVRAPALDANGLSARGLEFCRRLVEAMPDWTLMSGGAVGRSVSGAATSSGRAPPTMDSCPHCYRSLLPFQNSQDTSMNDSRRSSGEFSLDSSLSMSQY